MLPLMRLAKYIKKDQKSNPKYENTEHLYLTINQNPIGIKIIYSLGTDYIVYTYYVPWREFGGFQFIENQSFPTNKYRCDWRSTLRVLHIIAIIWKYV